MNRPSSRCGNPAFGMIERGGSSGPALPIAFRALIEALGPAPQLTPTTSAPAEASRPAARSAVVPSASVRSSPNVSEAMTGMSAALRASSSAISSCSRSENVSSTTTSMPPSSRPSSCSRNIVRAARSESPALPRFGGASGPIGAADERVAAAHLAGLAGDLGRPPVEARGPPCRGRPPPGGAGWRRATGSRSARHRHPGTRDARRRPAPAVSRPARRGRHSAGRPGCT